MRAYVATFTKADGTPRRMYFARLDEMPAAFLETKTTGTCQSPQQGPGKELVWDLQAGDFRVFNNNTVRGEVVAFEFDENKLV